MRIRIDPETEEEKKEIDSMDFKSVSQFAICGTRQDFRKVDLAFSHVHIIDSFVLSGRLFELIERLRSHKSQD